MKYLLFILLLSLNVVAFSEKDTINYTIDMWSIDAYQHKTKHYIDTALNNFHIYNPAEKQTAFFSSLGNTGQASQNNIFFERTESPFLFTKAYSPQLYNYNNLNFFNTHQAFTQIQYVTNFSKKTGLQDLDLTHTQNINPYINIGIQYRLISDYGKYMSSQTKNHALRLFSSYEGHHYNAYWAYHYNKLNAYLNGGIKNDSLLGDAYYVKSSYIPVNLNQFKQHILNRNLYLNHTFIGNKQKKIALNDSVDYTQYTPTFKLGHIFNMDYYKRAYNNTGGDLYSNLSADSSNSQNIYDSTSTFLIHNSFYGELIPNDSLQWLTHGVLGYRNEWERYYSYLDLNTYMNHVLFSQFRGVLPGQYTWEINAEWDIAGSNRNDFMSSLSINKPWGENNNHQLLLETQVSAQNPDVFLSQYASHYFSWHSSLKKISTQKIKLSYRYKSFKIGSEAGRVQQFTYIHPIMDSSNSHIQNIEIHQEPNNIILYSGFIQHYFRIGPLHMKNIFVYQKSSESSVVHIPELNFLNITYFSFYLFKKNLKLHIGANTRYNSSYFVDGFDPASGLFYQQSLQKRGAYPYIDFFINMKLKKALFFFKLEHINEGMSGYQYFNVYHYPQNPRVFRFGLSWRFYN